MSIVCINTEGMQFILHQNASSGQCNGEQGEYNTELEGP